jgi:hypothetical protein
LGADLHFAVLAAGIHLHQPAVLDLLLAQLPPRRQFLVYLQPPEQPAQQAEGCNQQCTATSACKPFYDGLKSFYRGSVSLVLLTLPAARSLRSLFFATSLDIYPPTFHQKSIQGFGHKD